MLLLSPALAEAPPRLLPHLPDGVPGQPLRYHATRFAHMAQAYKGPRVLRSGSMAFPDCLPFAFRALACVLYASLAATDIASADEKAVGQAFVVGVSNYRN